MENITTRSDALVRLESDDEKEAERSSSMKKQIRRWYTRASAANHHSRDTVERKLRCLVELGYSPSELALVPGEAIEHAFSCGNPLSQADVRPGQTVVDIGSGAGLDCLILARRLGDRSLLIGLDLTPGMAVRATSSAKRAGVNNVCFGVGDAEAIPMDDESVDVVISNGAICLTVDKERAFREVYRVLQPGGLLSVSDLLFSLPPPLRLIGRHLSGVDTTVSAERYEEAIRSVGFQQIQVQSLRTCRIEQAVKLWGVRPVMARLSRLGCHPFLRPAVNYFLSGISSVHLTAVKPNGVRSI